MIVAALDPASSKNACALAVLGQNAAGIWLPLHLKEWIPIPGKPLDLRLHVLPEAARIVKRLGCHRWATDPHASTEVRLVSQEEGIQYVQATSDVREHWRHLTAVVMRKQLALGLANATCSYGPAWPDAETLAELKAQLGRVKREFIADGWRVTIPEIGGLHGDLAVAVARALWLAKAGDVEAKPDGRKFDPDRYGQPSRYASALGGMQSRMGSALRGFR